MNDNNFFIENGFLSIQFTNNFIKKYLYLGYYSESKIENILDILNTNIKYVKICENIFEKNISILINNKEYIKAVFNDDDTQKLFIFYLEAMREPNIDDKQK